MSIIKMQRVAVIGLGKEKETLMSKLMDFGAVELTDQSYKLSTKEWSEAATLKTNPDRIIRLEGKLNRANLSLDVIEKYGKLKNPLFKTRRAVARKEFENMKAMEVDYEEKVEEILELNNRLGQIQDRLNKLEQDVISLTPWEKYGLSLSVVETKNTDVFLGTLPSTVDTNSLTERVYDSCEDAFLQVINSDRDLHYIALILMKENLRDDQSVMAILKQHGFSQITFKEVEGTPRENLIRIQGEKDVLKVEYQKTIDEIEKKASYKNDIEAYADIMTMDLDQEKIKSKLLNTETTFFLEGWVPTRLVEGVSSILEQSECYYAFREPLEDETVPVLMENKNFFVPFEAITEMYSLPDYRGFDPTSIYALFYAIFFGMMLSDAGYGILMAVACFVVLKKFNLEGTTYKMIRLFMYCGVSTTFWGAMFGGWFGDFFQVFARTILGKEITIEPLWFNPIEDPMKLLIFSLILGVIHIFIGMGIKSYMQIREGKWIDAICDQGFWYLVIIGIVAWLAGGMIMPVIAVVGKWMTIVGALGLLLTGGRHSKGFGKIVGGLGSIYNITSYMSDILSYARILALGLATGVIAQVVNTMGSMLGGGIVGLIVLMVAFVGGHALNLVINALGAFIHASRLQYIEFFGKFYEDGGEPFDPFRKKTKYIRITDE